MPATECFNQTAGTAQTFRLRDGRTVELRSGCLVDVATRLAIAGSHEAAGYLLEHGRLTADERQHWQEFGRAICHAASFVGMSRTEAARMAR